MNNKSKKNIRVSVAVMTIIVMLDIFANGCGEMLYKRGYLLQLKIRNLFFDEKLIASIISIIEK